MFQYKTGEDQQRRKGKIQWIWGVIFSMFLSGTAFSQSIDWGPPTWGKNLEELNQIFIEKNKSGLIKEDKERSEIELQYTPAKSLKIRRGNLTALISAADPSSAGRLYGYSYEGKFFGKVVLFKDHPEFFPETILRTLKEKYPQGKIYRTFGTGQTMPLFEYKSDQLYVFTTSRGVFFYEPNLLGQVLKRDQNQVEQELQRYEKEMRGKPYSP
ncbi:MAG: hypothetical protein HY879_07655 [Deltaproteobacteria bacterium]|nr:hypothetical protein [Deltaproteobacteria bacterium]